MTDERQEKLEELLEAVLFWWDQPATPRSSVALDTMIERAEELRIPAEAKP